VDNNLERKFLDGNQWQSFRGGSMGGNNPGQQVCVAAYSSTK